MQNHTLQHTATHCSTHPATHCNTLQHFAHTASQIQALKDAESHISQLVNTPQQNQTADGPTALTAGLPFASARFAECAGKSNGDTCVAVLQRVAACCSVLQCAAVSCSVLQCLAVCCSVLQRVAVCCSVLQCLAVSCSVL